MFLRRRGVSSFNRDGRYQIRTTRRKACNSESRLGNLKDGIRSNCKNSSAQIGSGDMTMSGIDTTGYVEHKSSMSFQPTVDRLVAAIEKAGMSVFATIDHAGGAKAVGMSMPPSVVLIYGQARGGTPVMQADPAAALDLPLRVLIREDASGDTLIAFHPIQQTFAHYKVPRELAERLSKAQQLLVNSL
jgi:uncharacterized protein (DUF302 family)